jgi:hypothetical protein
MTLTHDPDAWVLAAPFRAHLRQVQAASGLPWPVLALAAGVSPALVRHLVFGRQGRLPHRISPESARRLLTVDVQRLAELAAQPVPAGATAERVQRLLASGWDPADLAAWCRVSRSELAALPRAVRCGRLLALLVQSACPPELAGDEDGPDEAAA